MLIHRLSFIALLATLSAAAPVEPSKEPRLALPIACLPGKTCEIQNYMDRDPGPGAKDYRCGSRTYEAHSGLDIRLPDMVAQKAGVAVLAAAEGKVLRVRDGVIDQSVRERGAAAVQGQECGNGVVVAHPGGLSTQYCHMAMGSLTVKPGAQVRAGDKLGLVGVSGNSEYPHLHFTVRRGETVIDPFAPDIGKGPNECGSGPDLWSPEARAALAYKAGAVLNFGFSPGPVDMAAIEAGNVPKPSAASGALIAYVRAIGLEAGDQQSLTLTGPDGRLLVEGGGTPLARNQAQRLLYVGKPRPAKGWASGRYEARYRVIRDQGIVLEQRWGISL